jgi:hypothetical protein|tara:strand:- start:157 stop:1002 length:846 start_codon:yes stop_codon:yes gene_type:complete
MSFKDKIGFHKKWHAGAQDSRPKIKYSINEPIIQYIFNTLNIKQGFFLEFGAWDGINLSNARLLFENNWNGMFIEGDKTKFEDLRNNYSNTNILVENIYLDDQQNNINEVLKNNKIRHIDFCSIDVDGMDLRLFKTFKEVLPTVVCIEGAQVLHPLFEGTISFEIERDNVTQSLYKYNQIFTKMGYRLLFSYQDCFFIREEYFHLFSVSNNLTELYLDGLETLPRIPWLFEKGKKHLIKNEIIEYIIKKTNNENIDDRNLWVRQNKDSLSVAFDELRKKLT